MKTVFVGLSGGVDSAVSAALLKQQGYNVVGAFIKIGSPLFAECTWRDDRLDAMRAAAALGIPFKEIDFSDLYTREVMGETIAGYESGKTPNPDVLCNRVIKFGTFLDWAMKEGADCIATGHYARISNEQGESHLLRGADHNKDQSYFLADIPRAVLSRVLFPVGAYQKKEVRTLARRFELPNAERPDSQGLCFLGDINMNTFISRTLPLTKGPVVTKDGSLVGEHDGAALYTIGQRHGFNTYANNPLYVVDIDTAKNVIVVSTDAQDAAKASYAITDLNWIGDMRIRTGDGQARYQGDRVPCVISEEDGAQLIRFEKPIIAAPGQLCAMYSGEELILGARITRAYA